jgi:hypothetical protein
MRAPSSDLAFTVGGYVEWLKRLDGLSARTDAAGYEELVARCGPEGAKSFLAGPTPPGAPNSGCMVVQCGAVEHFFSDHGKKTPLAAPVGFDRWQVACEWAALNGALIAPSQWSPEAGDLVMLFTPPNHQHWAGLTELYAPGSSLWWNTIEGGSLDGPYQCVRGSQRVFDKTPEGTWGERYSGHHVVNVIRVRKLIEAYT